MRQTINEGATSYQPNSIGGGCPYQAMISEGGFSSYPEKVEAHKVRDRSASFSDHFSQATLFYHSQSPAEQQHIIDAFSFELGKVSYPNIRSRMVGILTLVDQSLAEKVAKNLGIPVPENPEKPINQGIPADADKTKYEPTKVKPVIDKSPALSMKDTIKNTIATRKVACLLADGVDDESFNNIKSALEKAGASVDVIAPKLGTIQTKGGKSITIQHSFMGAASVLFDAVFIPGGEKSIQTLEQEPDAIHFVNEAYRHCKAIATGKGSAGFINKTYLATAKAANDAGLIYGEQNADIAAAFVKAIAQHRFWDREAARKVPA